MTQNCGLWTTDCLFAKLERVARNEFDYIIAGGGMAGLSLAFYLNESRLRDKKILIIDRAAKTSNDHTWCFWEKENSAFEEKVFHRWKSLQFYGTNDFVKTIDCGAYEYKMLRAADFYEFVFGKIGQNPHIEFLQAEIETVEDEKVKTTSGEFYAREFIFDSFTRKSYDNLNYRNLWQHFAGWTIETEENIFDPQTATLFDFRVEQKNECRFIYILPVSTQKALIEFTVFSDNLLEKSEYEFYLRQYLKDVLKIENYKIIETETGVIPMSDEPHEELPSKKIIRIGTSGGYVKPSTGYSFRRTQQKLKKLVESLEIRDSRFKIQDSKIESRKPIFEAWKTYLDSVLLDVLLTKKHPAADVFTHLFRDNPAERVWRFLDEETSFSEDLQVMRTVPLKPFAKAAFDVLVEKFK